MIEFDYTLLIQFANFLLLLIFLKFFLFDPVLSVMRQRESTLSSLSLSKEERLMEAERKRQAYEEALRQKKVPILEERDLLLLEEKKRVEAFLEREKAEIQKELSNLREELKRQERRMIEGLQPQVERLSQGLAGRILKEWT